MNLALALAVVLQCPDGSPPPCAIAAPRATVSPRSIGVLYFANRSTDSADAYLADGLTEGIIRGLTASQMLEVRSTSAVERLRGRSAPPDSAGRVLRVANLVTGSVQRYGHRVRVSVELVRAVSGTTLWAGQFDRDDADIFEIQTAIADTVSRAIAGRLLPAAQRAARPTVNGEAYNVFLQANYRLARRTPEDVRLAIRDYETALQLDPGFAAAQARIALAYGVALDWGWPSFNVQAAIRAGLAASARALELDSTLADAWTARGYILRFANARTYAGVREAFTRAVRLAPRDAEAHLQYGWALANLGQVDSGIATLRRAVALDPERSVSRFTLAWVLLVARRPAEALGTLDTAVATDPTVNNLRAIRAWCRLIVGDTAGALEDINEERADRRFADAALVRLELVRGDTAAARLTAARLASAFPPAPARVTWGAAWSALGYAVLNDEDAALDILERIEPEGLSTWWMTMFPGFDGIRDRPRFRQFVAELAPTRR